MKRVLLCLCLIVVSACATDKRGPVSFSGEITLPEGESLRDNYFIILRETRRDGGGWGSISAAVEIIYPDSEGAFSYDGYVCPEVALIFPYGGVISHSRTAPEWSEPIRFHFTEEHIDTLREGPTHESYLRSATNEIQTLRNSLKPGETLKDARC